ncbi:MAG TPA: MlaD family protein [Geminicoccaceae bacterium]|nr:MlaD family protein [Geminicoccus sp.]HMU50354.1 MlaD family protein [Geminicoccaceae bacterium]
METRASYALVGGFVLLLLAGLAGFAVWLAKLDVDRSFAEYEVAFTGSVNGLQEGSVVRFRGVPVGRVATIRIDPADLTQILVGLELRPDTPVRPDTVATVEAQGITGIAAIQLSGGTQALPPLVPDDSGRPPRLRAGRSALEQVFDSTPMVLARIATVLERMDSLLSDENLDNINGIIDDVEVLADRLADAAPLLSTFLGEAGEASRQMRLAADKVGGLSDNLRGTVSGVEGRLAELSDRGSAALGELSTTARSFRGLATRLDSLVRQTEEPVTDFSQSTLYEFRQLVAELRQLAAAYSRIGKELERDPAGYLLGGQQRGFQPP